MTRASADGRRAIGPGKRLAFLGVGLIAVVATVEMLVRIAFLVAGIPQTPSALSSEMERTVRSMGRPDASLGSESDSEIGGEGRYSIHPYSGYISARGLRVFSTTYSEFRSPVERDEYFVLVLGGSVGAIFQTEGRKRFAAALEASGRFGNRRVKIIPHARAGYKQPQQATTLAYLLSMGYEPDAVINIDGYNEVALTAYNYEKGAFPFYPSLSHWAHLVVGETDDEVVLGLVSQLEEIQKTGDRTLGFIRGLGLHYSALAGRLGLMGLTRTRARFGQVYEEYVDAVAGRGEAGEGEDASRGSVSGPRVEIGQDEFVGECVEIWKRSSRSLEALSRARGIHYLHVLQPTLEDQGSKPLTEQERASGWTFPFARKNIRAGYPLFRRGGEELKRGGLAFHDASMIFKDVKETLYYDNCHFKGLGLEIFVDSIAAAFLDSLPN